MNTIFYPPNIQWELTTECNHDCLHCYNYWRKDSEKAHCMRMKPESEYLAIAERIIKQHPVSVILTGGEPLYAFENVKSSIELLQSAGIYTSINTNAALLTDEICIYLREHNIALFASFPCANEAVCDKITNTKGSFRRIVNGLDVAKKHGVRFSNNIVVSTENLEEVEATVAFLKERYDVAYVSVTRVSKPINSDDSFDYMLLDKDELKRLQDICVLAHKKYDIEVGTSCPFTPCSIRSQEAFDLFGFKKLCTAGKTSYTIDIDGNIKACPRDSRLYGNVLLEDFSEIWERMHEWRDGSFIPAECKNCKELSRCLGGCRVDRIPFSGRSDEIDLVSIPENIPIKFEKRNNIRSFSGMNFVFDADNMLCVVDNNFYRISCGRSYVMVTSELHDFLYAHRLFSHEDVMSTFGIDNVTANLVIGRLFANNIVKFA